MMRTRSAVGPDVLNAGYSEKLPWPNLISSLTVPLRNPSRSYGSLFELMRSRDDEWISSADVFDANAVATCRRRSWPAGNVLFCVAAPRMAATNLLPAEAGLVLIVSRFCVKRANCGSTRGSIAGCAFPASATAHVSASTASVATRAMGSVRG